MFPSLVQTILSISVIKERVAALQDTAKFEHNPEVRSRVVVTSVQTGSSFHPHGVVVRC